MPDLTTYERNLLRHLAGLPSSITGWGALMGVAVEILHEQGLIRREKTAEGITYTITDAGRAAIGEEDRT